MRSVEDAALEEARRRLRHLLVAGSIVSWGEQGADADDPKKKLAAAIVAVEHALGEAERVLTEVLKCRINKSVKGDISNAIPFIKHACEAAIPELRRARPAKGRHGRYADSNAPRDRAIAETVEAICKQYRLFATRNEATGNEKRVSASWVVSKALKSAALEYRRASDPAWIKEHQRFLDNLWLSENRIEDIWKRSRS